MFNVILCITACTTNRRYVRLGNFKIDVVMFGLEKRRGEICNLTSYANGLYDNLIEIVDEFIHFWQNSLEIGIYLSIYKKSGFTFHHVLLNLLS